VDVESLMTYHYGWSSHVNTYLAQPAGKLVLAGFKAIKHKFSSNPIKAMLAFTIEDERIKTRRTALGYLGK